MPENVDDVQLSEPIVRHMSTEVTRLRAGQTVGEAIAALRASPPPARIAYFYVVDDENRLKGVVPARSLLLNPSEARLDDVMRHRVVAVPENATVLDACEFFVLHRFLAFPVVDRGGRLVGAIDVDLYTNELRDLGEDEDQGDDLFQLIGVHLARARQKNAIRSFRTRFPWLMCNIAGGTVAALLTGLFQQQIERTVALALFIPVVLALAESVSIQSVSLTLQLLHGDHLAWKSIFTKVRRELAVGLLLGIAAGITVGLVAQAWLGSPRVALSVLGGVASGVVAAALLGAATPNILRRLKLDPHLAAGPVVLAATDVVTLLCYFLIAWRLLG